ncbi:MarR family winged helix-turn-helix transcriptional regulator [Ramlibacter algicola]|jgi:DNA-binding MarR family transcriptional regulator|uniref:Winged helix-turn-helix transcriptional regulator n=1 Tax=Ramlibacter algicola TaxID=2795217 RepID=A0A934Q3C1_9BURK|nr:MarR family winged helix-turn-helix transcriptional regulator [Ramlibacter algicola]MBK0393797.1 winged helix-turn-helix transcriptional regulator [Ramlibacter algicola]
MAERDVERAPHPCYSLAVRQAGRWITQLYDQHLAEVGLTSSQFGVLSHLDRLGPVGLAALAQAMVMDRTTLTRNLVPLERDGLVEIVPGQDDRRRKDLTLTPAGRDKLKAARPHWRSAQASFEKHFGAEDATALRSLLHAVPRGRDRTKKGAGGASG